MALNQSLESCKGARYAAPSPGCSTGPECGRPVCKMELEALDKKHTALDPPLNAGVNAFHRPAEANEGPSEVPRAFRPTQPGAQAVKPPDTPALVQLVLSSFR